MALFAGLAAGPAHAFDDPLAPFNRWMFTINKSLRGSGAEEVASTYRDLVSENLRRGLKNIFDNLREPITIVASLFSGDLENAHAATVRFLINSSIGILGYYDVATRYGWLSREEDLGQIACSWGLPEGPYVILPFYGSGTIPDMVGRIVVIVAGYQFFGRAYFPYRVLDRTIKVVNGDAGPLTGRSQSYEQERSDFIRDRIHDCANIAGPKVPGTVAQTYTVRQ